MAWRAVLLLSCYYGCFCYGTNGWRWTSSPPMQPSRRRIRSGPQNPTISTGKDGECLSAFALMTRSCYRQSPILPPSLQGTRLHVALPPLSLLLVPIPISGDEWPYKFPAKEHCSKCGLCETTFVSNVTEACAFLPQLGMRRIDNENTDASIDNANDNHDAKLSLEAAVHGRTRNVDSIVWSSSKPKKAESWPPWQNERAMASAATTTAAFDTDRAKDSVEEARFGVLHEAMHLAQGVGLNDNGTTTTTAQWTGVVTSICLAMLESGAVDAVVCIAAAASAAAETDDGISGSAGDTLIDTMSPQPIVAKTAADILRGRGVKPCLAPSLAVLDAIQADTTIRRLLYCGVGCSVQAFRVVQERLIHLEHVYVLGTNCADNSPTPQAAATFLTQGVGITNLDQVDRIRGYEFMTDYRVHVKREPAVGAAAAAAAVTTTIATAEPTRGPAVEYITKPYFALPATIAEQSIAKSCLACFDYTNALADVVVGYMGAPPSLSTSMTSSWQTLTIRNARGAAMVQTAVAAGRLRIHNQTSPSNLDGLDKKDRTGSFETLAVATLVADPHVQSMLNQSLADRGMPVWLGEVVAWVLRRVGPTGWHFARYSIDYHILRNYLYVLNVNRRKQQRQRANLRRVEPLSFQNSTELVQGTRSALPKYAQHIVQHYATNHADFQSLEAKISSLTQ